MKSKCSHKHVLYAVLAVSLLVGGCSEEPVNEEPDLTIFIPKNNAVFTLDDDLVIKLLASDKDGEVTGITVFLNEIKLAEMGANETELNVGLSGYTQGDYELKAVVIDDNGAEFSESIDLTIKPAMPIFTDPRDGNVYRTVKIGNQTWMADNLAYLPEVSPFDHASDTVPSYYVQNYDGDDVQEALNSDGYSEFGVLYNWAAALISAPEGWHLPSHSEWRELEEYVASEHEECVYRESESDPYGPDPYLLSQNYDYMAQYLLHTSGWGSEGNGINTYSLSLRPSHISGESKSGSWWTSSLLAVDNDIWTRFHPHTLESFTAWQDERSSKCSVRCIKND